MDLSVEDSDSTPQKRDSYTAVIVEHNDANGVKRHQPTVPQPSVFLHCRLKECNKRLDNTNDYTNLKTKCLFNL